MAISIRIEKDFGVAVVSCSGVLRFDDAQEAAETLWKNPGWRGESAVWDFRAAQFDVSSSDVPEIANFILEHQPDQPNKALQLTGPAHSNRSVVAWGPETWVFQMPPVSRPAAQRPVR